MIVCSLPRLFMLRSGKGSEKILDGLCSGEVGILAPAPTPTPREMSQQLWLRAKCTDSDSPASGSESSVFTGRSNSLISLHLIWSWIRPVFDASGSDSGTKQNVSMALASSKMCRLRFRIPGYNPALIIYFVKVHPWSGSWFPCHPSPFTLSPPVRHCCDLSRCDHHRADHR